MGRPVVLSNGQLFVGLDEHGLVHDFYYPYVGLDDLTNARSLPHKIGVWVEDLDGGEGHFSWTDDGSWSVTIGYHKATPVSSITLRSERLGISLQLHDFVDAEHNAFVRTAHVANEHIAEREVRLFMHQVFQISHSGRADTAVYVPDGNYILDYKGRCCLVIGGKISSGGEFDQYAVGNYAIEGKAGTFKDAEDGVLSGNAVEHGGVDSAIRFSGRLAPGSNFAVDYWVVAADSETDARAIHHKLQEYSIANRRVGVQRHWEERTEAAMPRLETTSKPDRELARTSLLVIAAHCDSRGSILASGDSSIFNFGRDYYCYCWPRDAAYAIWPLIRLNIFDEAIRFFEFARDTRHPDGYLMHKYQPDRAIGSTWHPLVHNSASGRRTELAIQEDETAIVIFMIGELYRRSHDKTFMLGLYDTLVGPAANFMAGFIDESTGLPHASYDLWEQKFLTSTYTVSTVIAGLETAAQLADESNHPDDAVRWRKAAARIRSNLHKLYKPAENGQGGYFRKGLLLQEDGSLEYDDSLDISNLYGAFMFSGLHHDDPMLMSTLQQVEARLLNSSPIGGVIRFEHDDYFLAKRQFKGNPWIVCTLWLAQVYLALGRDVEAQSLLAWSRDRAGASGVLSEQFDPEDGHQLGVTPLVWSHAELINTVLDALPKNK